MSDVKNTTAKAENGSTSKKDKTQIENELLSLLQSVQARLDAVEDENKLLLKVADKHKIQREMLDNTDNKVARVRIHQEYDKDGEKVEYLITGWRMVRDSVTPKTAFDDNLQMIEVVLSNGETRKKTYYDFAVTDDHKVEVPIVKITSEEVVDQRTKTKHVVRTFQIDYNGEIYELGEAFIN